MNEEINIPNNTEIDKALKQFEAESQGVQTPKTPGVLKTSSVSQKEVEGVRFDLPSYGAVKYYQETEIPGIVRLTMKYSGIKEQKHAEYVLLVFVVVAIGIAIGIFFKSSNLNSTSHPIDNAAMQLMIQNMGQSR